MDRALMMLLSGFLDALNPCVLSTASIFGLLLLLLRDSRSLLRAFAFPFLFFYFTAGFLIQAGWGTVYFSSISYQLVAILFYLSIGTFFIGIGIWLLLIWLKMRGGRPGPQLRSFAIKEPTLLRFLGAVLGLGLAVPIYYWPQHWWATTIANDQLLPGKVLNAYVGMACYGAVRLWPFWLISWAYRSIRRNGVCAAWIAKRPSLIFAVSAAFFMGLGFGLVLVFFQKI
jgi:hypothetical protein